MKKLDRQKDNASEPEFSFQKTLERASKESSDNKLFKLLRIEPFKNIKYGRVEFVGEVTAGKSKVKIWVCAMPMTFWKFEIYDTEGGIVTKASTGAGKLSDFWPTVRLIAENMFVIDYIK